MTIGTKVEWESQAHGITKTKRGKVCAIIPADTYVRHGLNGLQRAYAKGWSMSTRPEESYVVHVPSKSGKGVGKLYWPHVKHLREVSA